MIEKSSINSDLSLYLLSYSRCSFIKHSYSKRLAKETCVWINHHRSCLSRYANFQLQIREWDQTFRHIRRIRKIKISDTDIQWSWQSANAHSIIYYSKNESANNSCSDSVHYFWLSSLFQKHNSNVCVIKNFFQQRIFHTIISRAWFIKELDFPSCQISIRCARDRSTLI
jgi:hypothetical protein